MRAIKLTVLALTLAVPSAASAARTFNLSYTTFVDATSGPAVAVSAVVTTDDGSGFGDNGFFVTGISGTRGTEAITFYDNFDEIFYPANASGDYFDSFGLTFIAGGTFYNIYKGGAGDFAYHENDGSVGRIVYRSSISLTPTVSAVPEPSSWFLLLAGFGLLGGAMRYRRRKTNVAYV